MNSNEEILLADYGDPDHARILIELLDEYARHPMGGGRPLSEATKGSLVSELARVPAAFSLIALVDGKPAGLANCFQGFSTFACKPLINIHDLMVSAPFRGTGLAGRLLQAVEAIARDRGCCKLTLEVLEGNHSARRSYRKAGFAAYELDPAMGQALFWEKKLE
ncbi:MAG: GNAT family N-acetyltransferase [Gammaproteobacteria bacterium]|nr:MAG: GNAT family N-acetyltransferase [Gammaproteobacteria bacterium]RTZ74942.1 MAG: GNAT family N-acetyltransferase [Gammaproteobacteria bacterium]RTZ78035.1 MAG: GNAT family N-acetyltransferase [Gammaproteobacteria bacterium]